MERSGHFKAFFAFHVCFNAACMNSSDLVFIFPLVIQPMTDGHTSVRTVALNKDGCHVSASLFHSVK